MAYKKGLKQTDVSVKGASLSEAMQRIEFLERENRSLREELAETNSLYLQLTKELRHEKFDERRVNMLKSQIIQLERQLLLLNDALGARMSVVLEAENSLQQIVVKVRTYQTQDVRMGGSFLSKDDLESIVECAESARLKLYKNIENTTMQRLHKPLRFMDKFIKQKKLNKTTLLDVCSGDIEHINLKEISKLESRLCQLYAQLLRVNHGLTVHLYPDDVSDQRKTSSHHLGILSQSGYIKLLGQCSKACNMLKDLLPDMLELSLLVPAAPWPSVSRPLIKDVSVDDVMRRMPAMSKAKSQEAVNTVLSLLKAMNLLQLNASVQEKTYREELQFHKNVHELQIEYIDNLFKALRLAYEEFERDTVELICQPLERVLQIFSSLRKTGHEEALRIFLAKFKENEPQLSSAVKRLRRDSTFKGQDEGLSSHAAEFFEKLDVLFAECQETRDRNVSELQVRAECQVTRDRNVSELQEVKAKQSEYWSYIRQFMHDDDGGGDVDASNSSSHVTAAPAKAPAAPAPGVSELPAKPSKRRTAAATDGRAVHEKSWDSSFASAPAAPAEAGADNDVTARSGVNDDSTTRTAIAANKPMKGKTMKRSSRDDAQGGDAQGGDAQESSVQQENSVQYESEALFKSLLRMGVDDEPGLVFDTDSGLQPPQQHATPALRRGVGQTNANSRPAPLKQAPRKLMKGVAQSKLVLKPVSTGQRGRSLTPHDGGDVQ